MSANLVAREVGYHMSGGWSQGDTATNDYFKPIETFPQRFDALAAYIAGLGFTAMDIWSGHLNPSWATDAHVKAVLESLKKHNLTVASLAGGFGSNLEELATACRLAKAVGAPVLGGATSTLKERRAEAVAILRAHGVKLAYENHPQKNAAELLATIGEGDEDVIGVALDTGWFGTYGADAATTLRELRPRLFHIHLKDVKAPRATKTGFQLIDMGHETCRLGAGVVGIDRCLQVLIETRYTGSIAIEHEPEDFDPTDDVRASRDYILEYYKNAIARGPAPLRVAVVGCGNIADLYARQLSGYPTVKIVGFQDLVETRAAEFAKRFGGRVYATLEDVLRDSDVQVVLNLTIHHAHAAVIRQCLLAGKHVHSEKPLALDPNDAAELVALAKKQGVRLSCAPVTWIGEAQQTAAKIVRSGELGTIRAVYAEINHGRIESWHPHPAPFYDVGVIWDVAIYPLTLLTAFLGPIRELRTTGHYLLPERRNKAGETFKIGQPDFFLAELTFANGTIGRLTTNFYVLAGDQGSSVEFHGDDGDLVLGSSFLFDAPVKFTKRGEKTKTVPPIVRATEAFEIGRGVDELARAIQTQQPHLTSAEHARHIVDVITAMHRSADQKGASQRIDSEFPAPGTPFWVRQLASA